MSGSIHSLALCEAKEVGDEVVLEAFARVAQGVSLGAGVRVGAQAIVGAGATLGRDVTLGPAAQVGPGAFVEARVRIDAGAIVLGGHVHADAHVGARALVAEGLSVGRHAVVRPGTVVTRDVPANAIVAGNPAQIEGYVDTTRPPIVEPPSGESDDSLAPATGPGEVRRVRLPQIDDLRGGLVVAEFGDQLPFRPERVFFVFDVPVGEHVRGEHAHKECHQALFCMKGRCSIVVDDGTSRVEYQMDAAGVGLYVPPRIWATQYKHSEDALLVVFASHPYEAEDYVRDYEEFLALRGVSST